MMDYPLKYAPIQQHGGAPLVFLDGIQLHVLQMDKIRSKAGGSLIFYAASSKFLFETFDRLNTSLKIKSMASVEFCLLTISSKFGIYI